MTQEKPGDASDAPANQDPSVRRVAESYARLLSQPLSAGLYLVSTPIGNLGDMSLRALAVLARADHVFCEDTRVSLKLFSHFGLSRRLESYHEHNAERMRPRILASLARGESVALMSDAGTPLISDPGYKLAREAREQGVLVTCAPGPTAAVAALAASGLPTDAFFFAGFLPPRPLARRRRLEDLAAVPGTLIFYETPARLAAALDDLAAVYPGRRILAARELTKAHEEVLTGAEAARRSRESPLRGELVVLVAPPDEKTAGDEEIISTLQRHMRTVSLSEAVELTSKALKTGKKRVYTLALKLREGGEDHDQSSS